MNKDLTNLLPSERLRTLSYTYYVRLATVALSTLALLGFVHTALLVPSYLYMRSDVKTKEAHLAQLSTLMGASTERGISERSADVASDASALLARAALPRVTPIIEEFLALPRDGVRVTGIAITPGSSTSSMRLSGIAETREALRRYHEALTALSFVERADLPLSVYAAERDLSFTITLTGHLSP